MREEGYTEASGGDGFDLQVAPYYANSLRTFLGVDIKTSFDVWGATISPEVRLGYRYDFINAPVKLKAAFASTGGLTAPGNELHLCRSRSRHRQSRGGLQPGRRHRYLDIWASITTGFAATTLDHPGRHRHVAGRI